MKKWSASDLKKLESKGLETNLRDQKKAQKPQKSSVEKSSVEKAHGY
jgi:hypothetical protein